tara:strand:- start:17 stop:682 length:666 start_codon:yes stop_codon:yes gene_type:complete
MLNEYFDNNELDINKFNENFDDTQISEDEKLNNMKETDEKKKFHQLSLIEITNNTKEIMYKNIYEITSRKFSFKKFSNEPDRILYTGLFLMVIFFILYLLSYIFSKESVQNDINIKMPHRYNLNSNIKDNSSKKQIRNLQNVVKTLQTKLNKPSVKNTKTNTAGKNNNKQFKNLEDKINLLTQNLQQISSKMQQQQQQPPPQQMNFMPPQQQQMPPQNISR